MFVGARGGVEKKVRATYHAFVTAWRRHVGNAILPSTRRAIDRDWQRWDEWCKLAWDAGVYLNPYRPDLEGYCAFLDFYLTIFKPDTVRKYIKNINTASLERSGYHMNAHIPRLMIQRTFKAAAKRLGHLPPKTRLPLTVDILKALRPHFDFKLHDDRTLWAIICVGVFTLARIGELVPGNGSKLKVTLASVTMGSGKGILSLVGTKTDYKFKGVKLIFFRNDTDCCPFTAMSAYLTGRPGTNQSAPLFVDSFRNKITQAWVISRMRIKLRAASFQAEFFSGISLRKGGAQTLLKLRANDTIIMGMGRWISSCFNRYLAFDESAIQNWQTLMAGTQT